MSRKLDLSKFRGSDSEGEDDRPRPTSSKLELTDLKSKTFSVGITKKTKKDLEKEAEEKKRIEEEKAAALVLAEYEGAFEGRDGVGPSAGARGGRGMRAFGAGGGFVKAGGAPMAPEPPRGPAAVTGVPTGPRSMSGGFRGTPRAPSPPPNTAPKPKGKRAMDNFLQEIKHNQEQRDQRLSHMARQQGSSVTSLAAREYGARSGPSVEEESTNLFVANLPANISEEILGLHFAQYGPVATVKIMWPRGDEPQGSISGMMMSARTGRPGLQGFVSFMERKDAETAVQHLNEVEWMDSRIRVGWSKAVPRPLTARYDLGLKGHDTRSRHPPERHGTRLSSRSPSPRRKRRRSPSRSDSLSSGSARSRSPSPDRGKLSNKRKWLDRISDDSYKSVKAVADRIEDNGRGFEEILRERERDNPKFRFLFERELPEYHLFRWLRNGRYRFPTPPALGFEEDGYASLYSSDSSEDEEKESTAKGKIGRLARKRFEAMLRAMSGKRVEIARAMEFAMNRAEAADEVTDLVCQSLQVEDTPIPRKMARLFLVSDILHNSASSLPNVWRYRLAFEQRLPAVFSHLNEVYQSLLAYTGKIAADIFRFQIGQLLETWERWNVFPGQAGESFRDLFDGTTSLAGPQDANSATLESAEREDKPGEAPGMSKFKPSGFKSSFKPAVPENTVGKDADIQAMQTQAQTEDDVDGDPLTEEDLDGEVMDGDEDLDGEAMDEDLDGEAM